MGKVLPIVVALVLLIYAFFDIIATPAAQIRHLPKPLWIAVVLVPLLGPVLWLVFGTTRRGPATPPSRGRGVQGPDDDPDFLRGL